MKALRLSMFFALVATAAIAADSTQTSGVNLWSELQNALLAALYGAIAAFGTATTGAVGALAYKGWEWIKKLLAGTRQGQLFGILTTALEVSISKKAAAEKTHYWQLLKDLAGIFRDGKVDDAEKVRLLAIRKEIIDDAAEIAGGMIAECRGLAADQGAKYLAERLDALLGELEYRLTGSQAALLPSSLAGSAASES